MAMIKKYTKKNGSSAYMFKAYMGTDPVSGKRINKTKQGFKTKKEAQLALARLQTEIENSGFRQAEKMTFQQVYDLWVVNYELTVKESTFVKQTELYRLHVLPYFGHRMLDKITPAIVQKFANQNVKYKRYREFISNTSRIFEYAIRMNLIRENPVKKIIIPKPAEKLEQDKINYFTKDELTSFLKALDGLGNLKQSAFLRLLAMSGCRRGEILGLEWRSVNFDENYISITQTLARGKNRRLYLELPKTSSSKREIPLDAKTMDMLKRWRLRQRKDLLRFGHNSINDHQLVFSSLEKNSFIELATPRKWLHTILKENGIRKITLHGLRHTAATMMLESGLTLKDVSDRLGHASIEITSDLYIHITEKRKRENIDQVMNYLEK
ncbi:site-specific integrase [Enterococcus hirae]|nr:site-specific integrase [Enterococcus hirae]EMF0151135.1 site-specific integrase [Enterococcus hirae]EMF0425885.1 site-specific integrase [Enterococcus hirae]EMF0436192.1 site-specific integrase [Enterococcus hirae]EMF0531934.1 site-specific integrase [Enterococcus hirae]MBO1099216.1 site-specific integrase [Enterococcus hirae]